MPDGPSLTRATIRSGQLGRLQGLLASLVPGNSFYTEKFRKAGVRAECGTLEEYVRFPFTTKLELVADQAGFPPFGRNLSYLLERYTRYHQTSGTSGTPLRWLDTPESWQAMVQCWMEIFRAANVGIGDRIVFAFSFGPFIGFWLAFEAGSQLGALCLPAGGLSSSARVQLILENRATVLCCTPTYALRLAEVARKEGVDLGRSCVRRLIVAGEPGGSIPATRTQLEAAWPGARVFDHHGMTETGPVTFECPKRPGYLHILEAAYLAEVIEPNTGRPVDPGQSGELVLTTLARLGSPLLRYRTGDLVRLDPNEIGADGEESPCVCGRHELALAGGILGRIDDMVIVRGVNVYPSAVEDVLRACGGVAEYQVRVSRAGAMTELLLFIESDGTHSDTTGLIERIQASFEKALALRVPVQVVPPGSLPRFEMKARRWVEG